jgi:acetylornithine deacetylase/succinyl-diaminopimelate desuccinylase-like protein
MALGIPSVCVGNYMGGGIHTREEYLEIASVPVGLKITAEIILQYC